MDRRQPPKRTGRLIASPLVAVEYRRRFYSDPRPWVIANWWPPESGARYPTHEIRED